MRGRIARVVEGRAFGFIRGEDNKDYFFHKDDCFGVFEDLKPETSQGSKDGTPVSFEGEPGKEKGKFRARNVVPG